MISYPITLGNIQTRVLAAGTGDRAIVLMHGTASRADRWRHNIDALAHSGGYRVYAFDLPGHGFATKGKSPDYSVAGYADCLSRFLDHMNLKSAVLIGTSLGGHVASWFSATNRNKVEALILSGSMGLVPMGEEARRRIQGGANNQSREGVIGKLKRIFHDEGHVTEEVIEEEFQVNNSPGAQEAFAKLGSYIGDYLDDDTVGPQLATLRPPIPTMLIWGSDDRTVPVVMGEKARDLLNVPLHLIPDTAHCPYYEDPEAFNSTVIGFLRQLDGSS